MGCSSSVHAAPPSSTEADQQGAKQPVTPDSRLLRGQAYYAAGRTEEALKELNATIATWPNYARAYLERGNVRLDQKDFTLALGDYNKALALQPNLLQAYVMRCHARLALQQLPEALADAREAEKLDPENAQVRALKAQVRKAQAAAAAAAAAAVARSSVSGTGSGGGEEEDAFAGVDTPKSTPSPSVRKLCMVCMDAERECRLRPCFHAALCVSCAEGLMARGYGCPICSSKIEQVERGSFMRTFTVEEAQGLVASARVGASPAPSPGKSPLGRRFGSAAAGAPSPLEHIAEVDEDAHDATAETDNPPATTEGAGAAAPAAPAPPARAASAGSTGGGRPPTPPELEPHPLAARSSNTARGAAGGVMEVAPPAAEPLQGPPPPPLPGAIEVLEDERAEGLQGAMAAATASQEQQPMAAGETAGDARTAGHDGHGAGGAEGQEAASAEATSQDAAASVAAEAATSVEGPSGSGAGSEDAMGTSDGAGRGIGDAAALDSSPGVGGDRLHLGPESEDASSSSIGGGRVSVSGSGEGREILRLPRCDGGGPEVHAERSSGGHGAATAVDATRDDGAAAPEAGDAAAAVGGAVVATEGHGLDGGDDGSGGPSHTERGLTVDALTPTSEPNASSTAGAQDVNDAAEASGDDGAVLPVETDPVAEAAVPEAAEAAAEAVPFVISRVGSAEGPDALEGSERMGSGSGAISPGTSAHLAHSLADWIELHTDEGLGEGAEADADASGLALGQDGEAGPGAAAGVGAAGDGLPNRAALLSGQSFIGFGALAGPVQQAHEAGEGQGRGRGPGEDGPGESMGARPGPVAECRMEASCDRRKVRTAAVGTEGDQRRVGAVRGMAAGRGTAAR